jgi:alpha-beta hydrolase superfamily lysophospholipase
VIATHQEGRFEGVGGLSLYWQAWLPEGEPRAVVVLAHGASEHSSRYGWVGEQLAGRGFALYALDHRGHGKSEGARALIDRMANAVEDLDRLVLRAREAHPGRPVFLLGHSMGGAVALSYTTEHEDRLDGLVLSAPVAVLEAASPVTRAIGRLLSAVAPGLGVYSIDATAVSRDPEVVRDYEQDPLNYHGKLPARTVAELSVAVSGFPDAVRQFHLPLLVLVGTADRLVPPEGSDLIHDLAGSSDKAIEHYDGLYHEILNEPEKERVVADLAQWLEARS